MITIEPREERACYVDTADCIRCSQCHHANPAARARRILTRRPRENEDGACDICRGDLWHNGLEVVEVEIEHTPAKIF